MGGKVIKQFALFPNRIHHVPTSASCSVPSVECCCCLPQGSPLSPVLFTMYTPDLLQLIWQFHLFLYTFRFMVFATHQKLTVWLMKILLASMKFQLG